MSKIQTVAVMRGERAADEVAEYRAVSQSPQQLGATIIRNIERENNQVFSGFWREYQAMVLAASCGEEIDADRFGNLCFHLGVDVEKWIADIAAMEKRFELQKTAAQHDALEAKASDAEVKLNRMVTDRSTAWNAATAAIREQEEALRMTMFARDQTLEARDALRRLRATTAEETELQRRLIGTDRMDGFTLMGHADGLLDKIRRCEMACDPNANHREPSYVALRCDEFPATIIRECEAELAKLQKQSAHPPADRIAKIQRRIAVARGQLVLKQSELLELRRQAEAIRERQAELSAAANQ